jgi:anthranilate synthase/aminodeoxychorismate synthase-like glutamine amidotransferase
MGVCLGHQSIAVAFGATVSNAKELFHGKSSMADHNGKGIFKGLPNPLQVARYHSLSIVPSTVPDCLEVTATVGDEIMAIRHKTMPVVGLQFHPESINTPDGMKLIENFIKGEI